jgi:hypothetical protein
MKKLALSLAVLSAILLPTLYAAPAHAGFHTWVSHNGSDANVCSSARPCATFNAALVQTSLGGDVSCLRAMVRCPDPSRRPALCVDCLSTPSPR